MRLALLAMIALADPGCLGRFGPLETFDDMWQRVPPGDALITIYVEGKIGETAMGEQT